MLMTHIPMDHLTALAQQRQERLYAEAAAWRLARTARPVRRTPAWLLRVFGLGPVRRAGRPEPGTGHTAADHDLCA